MITKRFKLFTLLGFPIYIDLTWFIIAVLVTWSLAETFPEFYHGLSPATYWLMGLGGALGLFASILVHELGHAVVARSFNLPMGGITLFIFGGVAEMSQEPPSAKAEFFVAIAGPIVSVAIAAVCFAIAVPGLGVIATPVEGVIWYLGLINAVVVAFNLIPAFPLDGGRVLRSALWQFKGSLRWATRIAANIGAGFGWLLIALGVVSFISGYWFSGMWYFLIGMFVRSAAHMSYQQVLVRRALEGEPVERFMHADAVTVPPSTAVDRFVEDYVYKYHHKMFPVADNDRLLGCVTTRDVQQVPRGEWNRRTVGEIAEPCGENNTLPPSADAMQALGSMSQHHVSRVMVVRDGHLEGVLSLKDLLNFISLKVDLENGNGKAQVRESARGEHQAGSPNSS